MTLIFLLDVSVAEMRRQTMKKLQILSVVIAACLIFGEVSHVFAAKYDPLVEKAQHRLTELGYDAGTADGKMGQKTIEAIKQFQQAQGIAVTGKLDQVTVEKLAISQEKQSVPEQASSTFSLSDIKIEIAEALLDINGKSWKPETQGNKMLEVMGTLSQHGQKGIEFPSEKVGVSGAEGKKDEIAKLIGVGFIAQNDKCAHASLDFMSKVIIEGDMSASIGEQKFIANKAKENAPLSIKIAQNPVPVCFSFEIPETMQGKIVLHFVDTIIPLN